MRLRVNGAGLLLVVGLLAPSWLSASPAAELKARLNALETIAAEFRRVGRDTDPYVGRLWVAKPRQFRVETDAPATLLVSDGQSLWNYDVDLEQVVIATAGDNIADVPVLLFASAEEDIERYFTVTGYEDDEAVHYLLTPVDASSLYQQVTLTFADDVPVRLQITGLQDDIVVLEFGQVVLNGEIADERFTMAIPEHVDVIDER